jgi:hypothetical protein
MMFCLSERKREWRTRTRAREAGTRGEKKLMLISLRPLSPFFESTRASFLDNIWLKTSSI